MGCAGASKYKVTSTDISTASLQEVPTIADPGVSSDTSVDFSRQDSTSTFESGPPAKGPAQILHEELTKVEDLYTQGGYDLCLLSREGQTNAEPPFEEKALQCAVRAADGSQPFKLLSGSALEERLAQDNVAIISRKGKSSHVPNQDGVLYVRSGSVICCGLADGFGNCGSWVSDWVVQCAASLLLSEACQGQQLGETPKEEQANATLPSNYTMSRIFHIIHEALLRRAEAVGKDIGQAGARLSLCLVDVSSREVVTAWIGDAHCIIGQQDGSVQEVLTQVNDEVRSSGLYHSEASASRSVQVGSMYGRSSSSRSLFGYNEDIGESLEKDLNSNPALSRSMGSRVLHDHGGSHLAEVRRYKYGLQDGKPRAGQFLICATNGIWDALESQEAATQKIADYGREDPAGAVEALAAEARSTWNEDEEDEETDDISIIVFWF